MFYVSLIFFGISRVQTAFMVFDFAFVDWKFSVTRRRLSESLLDAVVGASRSADFEMRA